MIAKGHKAKKGEFDRKKNKIQSLKMNQRALTALVLLAIIHVSTPVNVILALRVKEAKLACEKIHGSGINDLIRNEMIKTKEFPNNEKYKCFMACWLKELRQIKDGKLDVDEILRVTKGELTGKLASFEKITVVIKDCAIRVEEANKTKNECELVYQYVKCIFDDVKKIPSKLHQNSTRISTDV